MCAAHLVGAVAAPQLLDRLVCAPGQLHRDVHPAALVAEARAGVEGHAGGGGVADDRHELLACGVAGLPAERALRHQVSNTPTDT